MPDPIRKLDHTQLHVAERIQNVLYMAYSKEAALIAAPVFPPLRRTVVNIQSSDSEFFGVLTAGEIVGVLELDRTGDGGEGVTIASLGVHAAHLRQGIGRRLVSFVLALDDRPVRVSTAVKNEPAVALYRQMGFRVVREETTPEGIQIVHFENRTNDKAPPSQTSIDHQQAR